MNQYFNLAGRVLIAVLFLVAGVGKIGAYAGTQSYMAAMGVPGALLPLVIVLELGGAAALIIGWQTRWAALALAVFSVLAAALFHHDLANQVQQIMFLKNLAIAGGLLVLAAQNAAQTIGVDRRLAARAGKA